MGSSQQDFAAAARQRKIDPRDAVRERLIVALDVPDAAAASVLVERLDDTCSWFKVGLELFVAAGPAVL